MSQTEVQLIKDAVIVNADVSGSAAIDVSKISGALPAAGGTITGDITFDGETAGRDIVFDRSDNSLEFADNAKARFGNGADLEIYHGGTNSIIQNTIGDLYLKNTNNLFIQVNNTEASIYARPNAAVELYYDGSKKFETTSSGVTLNGTAHLVNSGNFYPNSDGALQLGLSNRKWSAIHGVSLNINGGDAEFRGTTPGTTDMTWDQSANALKFADNVYAHFGTGDDLKIYHNGSVSRIEDSGTGGLQIITNSLSLANAANSESMIVANEDGAVELYYDSTKRLETFASGVRWTGQLHCPTAGDSIQFTGSSSNAFLMAMTDGNASPANSSTFMNFHHWNGSSWLRTHNFGRDRLYMPDNIQLMLGNSADLKLYHDGSNSFITNSTGYLLVSSSSDSILRATSNAYIQPANGEAGVAALANGAVKLYYDNSEKAVTNADGFRVSGALQSSSGNGNYYLRTQHTTIQEGGNSVTITLTGLTFSFGVFRIGGYASAGQASVSLHILFGGYMTHIANYNATVLANHAQGSSISLTKNNSSYVITITNNANNYDLFCNMMIESANSAFTMTLS